jgi:hypothetical protein
LAPLNETLFLEIFQSSSDGGAGNPETFYELRLARKTAGLAIFSGDDFGGELAGNGPVF